MPEWFELSTFHFLRPAWLLLFIVVLWVALRGASRQSGKADLEKIIAPHLLKALTIKAGAYHWFNPVNLGLILLSLTVLVLAGPTWQRQTSPLVEDEAVLVIALDLSNTMQQSDVQPTRLERAKQKIADLLALRGGAPTALIVYAGSAHQLIPLSNDPDIIRHFLASVESRMMPKAGKFPEKVLPLANRILSRANAPGSLLIIGDGVGSNTIDEFEHYFNDESRSKNQQLLVYGVGLEHLPTASDSSFGPSTETTVDRFETDKQLFGGAHLALQQAALQSLAAQADGYYQAVTNDKSDVLRLNRLLDHHLSMVEDRSRPWQDAGYVLLLPIALIFLFWFRKGWTLNWCVALLVVNAITVPRDVIAQERFVKKSEKVKQVSSEARPLKKDRDYREVVDYLGEQFINLWLSPDQQGRYYFERGDYASAARFFKDPAWQGLAFYYNENFAAAAELFALVDSPQGRFNLANALAQGQYYGQAFRVYSQVLAEVPDHAGALRNRQFMQTIIDEINAMTASQKTNPGQTDPDQSSGSLDGAGLGDNRAGQREVMPDQAKQLSAQQILADGDIHAMWMRQVQQDPARFLSAKFQLQLARQNEQRSSLLPTLPASASSVEQTTKSGVLDNE